MLGFGESGDHGEHPGVTDQDLADLCVMEPEAESREFAVTSIHPGATRDQLTEVTGWAPGFAADVIETPAPTSEEHEVLCDLQARTTKAHGMANRGRMAS